MKDKIYTIKEIDSQLQSAALKTNLRDVTIRFSKENTDTYDVAKYGNSQNIILLTKNDGTYKLFERIKKDGTIVEGSSKDDTEWREVGNEVITTENKK